MREVRDNFGALICKADDETGLMEHEYKKNRISFTVLIGQQFVIQRDNKRTTVVRTPEGFFATSVAA